MYYGRKYKSFLGDVFLLADQENLLGLWLGKQKYMEDSMPSDIIYKEDNPVLKETILWLDDYFAGKKPEISWLPLAPLAETDFRRLVWDLLIEIPYGQVITYGEIAKEIARLRGKEKMSAQAVGGAVGHNPISIIIPCHRVVGGNGNLTGYGGGIDIKIKLLSHEGVDMDRLYVPKTSKAP